MATIATRLTSAGDLLVNGNFDEFTGAPVVDSSLSLWLDAGQTASYPGSGTSWTDLSGNGNNGTFVGALTYDDINVAFDTNATAVTDLSYLAVTSEITLNDASEYSFNFWFKMRTPSSVTYQSLLGRGTTNPWLSIYPTVDGSSWSVRYRQSGATYYNSTSITSANVLNWTNLCLTVDSSRNVKIYVNGVYNQTINPTTTLFYISRIMGGYSASGNYYSLQGKMSAFMLYTKTLSAAEVLQNYNALAGRYELTANTSGTAITRTTANTVLATEFDEVTFNTNTPTITNLFYNSQDFSNNTWQKSSSLTISNTSAVLAPDGTVTAQLATVGGSGLYPYIKSYRSGSAAVVPCTPGVTYTVSAFVKYINQQYVVIVNEDAWTGGMSTRFDILNGTKTAPSGNVAATTITDAGGGWWRISATYGPVPANITYWNPQPIRIGSYDGTNYTGSQVYIWGAQLEASTSPSTYQGIAGAGVLTNTSARKITSEGDYYVSGGFDEFTGAPIIDDSLILWLDGGQTASYPGSGSTVYDLSPTGQNATIDASGVTFNPAGYFEFDGTANGIQIGSIGSPQQYTIEIWVMPTVLSAGGPNDYRRLLQSVGSSTNNSNFILIETTGEIGYRIPGGSTTNFRATAFNTYASPIGTWGQIVCSYDQSYRIGYFNGANYSQFAESSVTVDLQNLVLGSQTTQTAQRFIGKVAMIRVYNRALTADEVAQNFNALRRRYNI